MSAPIRRCRPTIYLSIYLFIPPQNSVRIYSQKLSASTAAHRLPAPLAARAQPAAASRHFGHMDPTVPHPLLSEAVGVVFRCWVPTSRCGARLTLRSPPTRTRRALFGRHAAADGLRRIISSLARCELDTSFSSNDSLGRPHLHSPSLACRVFLIKKPIR